jgi:3-deoxy-D-manno-octulosonic acid kinase
MVTKVPAGYVTHRVAETWLVLDREHATELVGLRLADASVREALFTRAPRRGRSTTPTIPFTSDLSIVLRRYTHGGLLGWLTGPVLRGVQRPLQELTVTARAEEAGAPVPHVLCLALWPIGGPFWSGVIGTREEADAQDLLTGWRESTDATRHALVRRVGRAIRRLHDAGVEHPDLQLRNVLLCPGDRIVVVDLDRARFHGTTALSTRRRATNLGRLLRSAVKEGLLVPKEHRRVLASLLGGYAEGDRTLRRALLGRARWECAKLSLHRLGYTLRR